MTDTTANEPTTDSLEQILQAVYNNGRMSSWKLSETNRGDILPWLSNDQALTAINNIRLQDRQELMAGFISWYNENYDTGYDTGISESRAQEYLNKLKDSETGGTHGQATN